MKEVARGRQVEPRDRRRFEKADDVRGGKASGHYGPQKCRVARPDSKEDHCRRAGERAVALADSGAAVFIHRPWPAGGVCYYPYLGARAG